MMRASLSAELTSCALRAIKKLGDMEGCLHATHGTGEESRLPLMLQLVGRHGEQAGLNGGSGASDAGGKEGGITAGSDSCSGGLASGGRSGARGVAGCPRWKG